VRLAPFYADYAELLTNPLDRAQAFRTNAGGGSSANIQKMFEREKRKLLITSVGCICQAKRGPFAN
jgi:hypothetical protein